MWDHDIDSYLPMIYLHRDNMLYLAICLNLSYFFAKTFVQAGGIEGNTLGAFPIDLYFLQIQKFQTTFLSQAKQYTKMLMPIQN